MWAWLIMDYVTKKDENGHWKCLLMSNMYICGELKERNLMLCYIPRPLLKCLSFMFGSRNNESDSGAGSCSRCSLICSVFLVPLAFAIGLIAVTLLLALIIAFLPVFLVFIFPCILVVKCREMGKTDNVRKMTEEDVSEEGQPLKAKEEIELATTNTTTTQKNGDVIKKQPAQQSPLLEEP